MIVSYLKHRMKFYLPRIEFLFQVVFGANTFQSTLGNEDVAFGVQNSRRNLEPAFGV